MIHHGRQSQRQRASPASNSSSNGSNNGRTKRPSWQAITTQQKVCALLLLLLVAHIIYYVGHFTLSAIGGYKDKDPIPATFSLEEYNPLDRPHFLSRHPSLVPGKQSLVPGNISQSTYSSSRTTPRIVAVELSLHNLQSAFNYTVAKPIIQNSSEEDDAPIIILMDESWYTTPNAKEFMSKDYDSNVCEPMHEWQLHSYPNCNSFHELEMRGLRLINKGGTRVAFEANQYLNNTPHQFVYKTIKFRKDVSERRVEEHRKDALAMGQASRSEFIPDIYGYCGVAIQMPFMPEGNLHDYIKGERRRTGTGQSDQLPPVDKLRIAIHIASGVADLHTVSTFFHMDLFTHQYLFQDGVFKLNDFNMAGLLYANKTSISNDGQHHSCTWKFTENNKYLWKGRSLEEFQLALKYDNYTAPSPEAVDIWMMGNLIYTILTDLYIFEKPERLNAMETGEKFVAGELPLFPEGILNSTDPSHLAMMKALEMCWTYYWQERPSARVVSEYLVSQLREIMGENDPDVRVVLPARDASQKGTDSDWQQANCDHAKDGKVLNNCM